MGAPFSKDVTKETREEGEKRDLNPISASRFCWGTMFKFVGSSVR